MFYRCFFLLLVIALSLISVVAFANCADTGALPVIMGTLVGPSKAIFEGLQEILPAFGVNIDLTHVTTAVNNTLSSGPTTGFQYFPDFRICQNRNDCHSHTQLSNSARWMGKNYRHGFSLLWKKFEINAHLHTQKPFWVQFLLRSFDSMFLCRKSDTVQFFVSGSSIFFFFLKHVSDYRFWFGTLEIEEKIPHPYGHVSTEITQISNFSSESRITLAPQLRHVLVRYPTDNFSRSTI